MDWRRAARMAVFVPWFLFMLFGAVVMYAAAAGFVYVCAYAAWRAVGL